MAGSTSLRVLLFTDLVGSTRLKQDLGDAAAADLMGRHDVLFRDVLQRYGGREQDHAGDGFFATFERATDAVRAALAFQRGLSELDAVHRIQARVGIHVGEVVEVTQNGSAAAPGLVGLAIDTAARVMGLAQPGQILLTRYAFDSARQHVRDSPQGEPVVGLSHGRYRMKGVAEALDVYEVGVAGHSPLAAPPDSDKAHRDRAHHPLAIPTVILMLGMTVALLWQWHAHSDDGDRIAKQPASAPTTLEVHFQSPDQAVGYHVLDRNTVPLRTGSSLQIHAKLPRRAYPYLFYLSRGNKPDLLYPQKGRHTISVDEIWYPSDPTGSTLAEWVTLAPPSGTEMLLLLVADTPGADLPTLTDQLAKLNWPDMPEYQYADGDPDAPTIHLNPERGLSPDVHRAPKGLLQQSIGPNWRSSFSIARVLAFPHAEAVSAATGRAP